MSSTNRGSNRRKSDYYVTPQKDISLFLEEYKKDEGDLRTPILDPCAGGDEKNSMSYPSVINQPMTTLDIREDSRAEIKPVNYVSWDPDKEYNTIITNPPFYVAKLIIKKALRHINVGGHVIMLLRLNYFGSQKRYSFWEDNMPKRCYVHHKRMSFTDDGKRDSIEYMHCVWEKGLNPSSCKLKII